MLRGRGATFIFFWGLLCLGLANLGVADERREDWADTVQFNFENDVFRADTNRDRNYTYGVDAVYASEFNTRSPLSRFHRWLHRPLLGDVFPEPSGPPLISAGIVAYSPDDLTNTMVIATNRPWASLVYFGTQNQWISANDKSVFSLNSMVGMLGGDVAEAAQAGIHVITDSDDPKGWHHQISDGGELTAMIAANLDRCLIQVPGRRGPWNPKVPRSYDRVQLWAGGGASVGYRTAANVHAGVAAGVITRPFFAHGAGGISPAQLGASPAAARGAAVGDAKEWWRNLGRWCWRIVPDEGYGYASGDF